MADPDPFLFVSHVAEDRAAALEIVDELERRGVPCWIAPRNVRPGSRFDDEISDALESCRAMLLIFSQHCNESEYIHREVTVAGESRKVIIPFRIEDVQPQRGLRVRLADLHWIDGFVSRELGVDQLARAFAPAVAKNRQLPKTEAEPPKQPDAVAEKVGSELAQQAAPPQVEVRAEPVAPAIRPVPPAPGPRRGGSGWLIGLTCLSVLVAAGVVIWFGMFASKSSAPPASVATQPPAAPTPATTPVPAPTPAAPVTAADALAKGNAALDRKDYAEAMRWFHQAADQGNASAQTNLGFLYQNGSGVPQDYAEAMRWYRKAADQGNTYAENNVGWMYESGLGVPQDYAEAMRWFRMAADKGNPAAQTNIGFVYQNGSGVPQDYAEAMRWYRKAADQGNADAEYDIGVLYVNGLGLPQDLAQGRQWMQKAAAAGSSDAKNWLADHGG